MATIEKHKIPNQSDSYFLFLIFHCQLLHEHYYWPSQLQSLLFQAFLSEKDMQISNLKIWFICLHHDSPTVHFKWS